MPRSEMGMLERTSDTAAFHDLLVFGTFFAQLATVDEMVGWITEASAPTV